MTDLMVNVIVGITFTIVGLGIGEILQRTAGNGSMPPKLRWLTTQRIVYFLVISLVLASMATTYTSEHCQARFNERVADREKNLEEHQVRATDAAIKALDNVLINPDRTHIKAWADELRELQAERKNSPPETEIRC